MKEPQNPYDSIEPEKVEKKHDTLEKCLYWLFAVPMALIGLLFIVMFVIFLFIIFWLAATQQTTPHIESYPTIQTPPLAGYQLGMSVFIKEAILNTF